MPKYYIQSGDVSMVVTAHDPEAAALWAIHQHSQLPEQFASGEVDLDPDAADWQNLLPECAALPEFGPAIRISERGFGRAESGRLATDDAMRKYGQLLVAIERLLGE